jgi:hypothetical protein
MIQANNFSQIYQFRIVLRELSPHIWRRILIGSDSTIVDLHQAIQIAFGWTDRYSRRFRIRGRVLTLTESTAKDDDPTTVPRLSEFHFFVKERFGTTTISTTPCIGCGITRSAWKGSCHAKRMPSIRGVSVPWVRRPPTTAVGPRPSGNFVSCLPPGSLRVDWPRCWTKG